MHKSAWELTDGTRTSLLAAQGALEWLRVSACEQMIALDLKHNAGLPEKDRYHLARHCQAVAARATQMCDHLGLSEETRMFVDAEAELHDVGKIRELLYLWRQPRNLTTEERRVVDKHQGYTGDWIRENMEDTPQALGKEARAGILLVVDGDVHHHHPNEVEKDDVAAATLLVFAADIMVAMAEEDRPGREKRKTVEEAFVALTLKLYEPAMLARFHHLIPELHWTVESVWSVDVAAAMQLLGQQTPAKVYA